MESPVNDVLSVILLLFGVIVVICIGWVCIYKLVLSQFKFVRIIMGLDVDQQEREQQQQQQQQQHRTPRTRRTVRKD